MKFLITNIVVILIFFLFLVAFPDADLDEFALDKETKVKFSLATDVVRHCEGITEDFGCLNTKQVIFPQPDVLLLGNSQLHAINQINLGNKAIGDFLTDMEERERKYIISSLPNANLCELVSQAELVLQRSKKIIVLMSAVYDDTRVSKVRSSLLKPADNENNAITLREKSEIFIRSRLQRLFNFEELLNEMKGKVLISLYLMRNSVFGIDASTTRPKNSLAYSSNMSCLEQFLLETENVNVILYIAPIRNDAKLPYSSNDYAKFKLDIKSLSNRYKNAFYYDLADLVPNNLWGTKDSTNLTGNNEIDFMHFQSAGHQILAKKLIEILDKNDI